MIKFYYRVLDAVSGGRVYPLAGWQGSTSRRSRCGPSSGSSTYRTNGGGHEHPPNRRLWKFRDTPRAGPDQRFLVEVPERFAVARWPRDADVSTIRRRILGTLKYEPHAADATGLRRALEGVIEHTARGGTVQKREELRAEARRMV